MKAFVDDKEKLTQKLKWWHAWFNASLRCINSLPNDKILDWSKFKEFADDKIGMTENLKIVLGRLENIMGKGKNASYQHFLPFPQCFPQASFTGSIEVMIVR